MKHARERLGVKSYIKAVNFRRRRVPHIAQGPSRATRSWDLVRAEWGQDSGTCLAIRIWQNVALTPSRFWTCTCGHMVRCLLSSERFFRRPGLDEQNTYLEDIFLCKYPKSETSRSLEASLEPGRGPAYSARVKKPCVCSLCRFERSVGESTRARSLNKEMPRGVNDVLSAQEDARECARQAAISAQKARAVAANCRRLAYCLDIRNKTQDSGRNTLASLRDIESLYRSNMSVAPNCRSGQAVSQSSEERKQQPTGTEQAGATCFILTPEDEPSDNDV